VLHAGRHGLGVGLRSNAFLLLPSARSLILICEIKCCDLVQVIEFPMIHFDKWRNGHSEVTPMLAEKFFLVLETLKSHAPTDGSPIVATTAQHIPIKLPPRRT
jgi:hypothetical protein